MKKRITSVFMATAILTTAWANDKETEITNKLIPNGKETATWESECKLSMKGVINIKKDKTFDMKLKAYSSTNCKEGTEYISLSRSGKYKYQAPVYSNHDYGNGYSYTYQVSPHQLNLNLSPVEVETQGVLSSLAEGLISMYQGCVGVQERRDKNENCINSGISKTKSRIRLSKMNFITPTTMIGEFRNDVNIEFNLVK